MLGSQTPRLESLPSYVSTAGQEAIELASIAGLYLDPWQRYVLVNAMGEQANGIWSAFEVCVICSRQNGKGSILEARELAGMYLIKSDRLLIHTAHEHKTSSEHFRRILYLIENTPQLDKKVYRMSSAYGREFIELKAPPTIILGSGANQTRKGHRCRLIFIARSAASGRGFTGDFLAYDEDMILSAEKVGASLPTLSARPNPQVFYMGSAGLKTSTQLALIRRRGVAKSSKRLAFFEWSINAHDDYCASDCKEHDDPDDIESIAKANPALGIRIAADFVASEREAMPEAEFMRERLGVGEYPAPNDGWLVIPRRWFLATVDSVEQPPRVANPVFAIDVAPDRGSAAISVAGLRPDGRVGIQVVDHKEGTAWLALRARQIQARWSPAAWVLDSHAAAGTLITELDRAGISIESLQAKDVAMACGLIFDAFRDDTLRHYGQSSLRAALAGADKRDLSSAWAFDRRNSGVDISPLMAATFALWGYQQFGAKMNYEVSESVHFDIDEIIRLYRAGIYGPEDIKRLHSEGLIDDKGLEVLSNAGIR